MKLVSRVAVGLVAFYGLLMCLMLVLRLVGDGESTLIAAINVSIIVRCTRNWR